jgi:hypothetical protein
VKEIGEGLEHIRVGSGLPIFPAIHAEDRRSNQISQMLLCPVAPLALAAQALAEAHAKGMCHVVPLPLLHIPPSN